MGVKYPTISQYRDMKWHDISISWLGYNMNPREEGKIRPLLVRFSSADKKASVMDNVKELRSAEDRYKKISLAHDLTPRQREMVKDVRKKAIDELENDSGAVGNFRIIVVGQRTNKPRALRIPR